MKNPALWERLQAFDFDSRGDDGAVAFSFSKRLARENDWDFEFTIRVVEEYRRFLYLACAAGHPVSPSDEVDEAWHLHLTYSRSYWEELCPKVLKCPLHHEPTKGGKAESEKFADWYEKTRQSYFEEFGESIPKDIWPDPKPQHAKPQFRRVNVRDSWVVPKPHLFGKRVRAPRFEQEQLKVVPILALSLFLAGCAAIQTEMQNEGLNVFNWHGEPFLGFFWAMIVVGLGFSLWMRSISRRPLDAVFPIQPLSPYEIARLKDGKNLTVDVAIASLYEKGAILITDKSELQRSAPRHPLDGFETKVWNKIGTNTPVRDLRSGMAYEIADIDTKLRNLGLLLPKYSSLTLALWPLGITLLLLAIGATKIIIGLSRDRPVTFLILSCIALVVLLAIILANPVRHSHRGSLYLKQLISQQSYPRNTAAPIDPATCALFFAMTGFVAFPVALQAAMRPPNTGSGSGSDSGGSGCSSSSSGCSSGDSGGGGGGCGGCGGGGGD